MKITIFYGKEKTGKTTQLINCYERNISKEIYRYEIYSIIKKRKILNTDIQPDHPLFEMFKKALFWDNFVIEDLEKIPKDGIDYLYIGCTKCPDIKILEKYFNIAEDSIEIIETMFPVGHFIKRNNDMYIGYFDGQCIENKNKSIVKKALKEAHEFFSQFVELTLPDEIIKELTDYIELIGPRYDDEGGLRYSTIKNLYKKLINSTGNKINITLGEGYAIYNYAFYNNEILENFFGKHFDLNSWICTKNIKKEPVQLKVIYKGKYKSIPKIEMLIYPYLEHNSDLIIVNCCNHRLQYSDEFQFLKDWTIIE